MLRQPLRMRARLLATARQVCLGLGVLALALLPAACGPDEPAPSPRADARYAPDGRLLGAAPSTGPRMNVLLVVLGSLRADLLDLETPEHGSMPLLARRARLGTAFEQASSAAPSDLPALASLLTSLLTTEHGLSGTDERPARRRPLSTWPEILASTLGYETAAWVAGPWRAGEGSVLEGFAEVQPGCALATVPERAARWARERDRARPWFLLLHSAEAGEPRDPAAAGPAPVPPTAAEAAAALARLGTDPSDAALVRGYALDAALRRGVLEAPEPRTLLRQLARATGPGFAASPDAELAQDLRRAHAASVRWVDQRLDEALSAFESAGLLSNTLVIVAGSHGEAFGEHGQLLHGRQLYDELLRVPLLLLGPEAFRGGRRIRSAVSLLDLLPTVLALLGLPPLPEAAGASLLPLLAADAGAGEHMAHAQAVRSLRQTAGTSDAQLESVRSGRWKYIVTYDRRQGTVVEEAYDLVADPDERTNRADLQGRVDGRAFDEPFCRAVERARDRVWGAVAGARFLLQQGYAADAAYVKEERPASTCAGGAPR